jgi:hypothetical protein
VCCRWRGSTTSSNVESSLSASPVVLTLRKAGSRWNRRPRFESIEAVDAACDGFESHDRGQLLIGLWNRKDAHWPLDIRASLVPSHARVNAIPVTARPNVAGVVSLSSEFVHLARCLFRPLYPNRRRSGRVHDRTRFPSRLRPRPRSQHCLFGWVYSFQRSRDSRSVGESFHRRKSIWRTHESGALPAIRVGEL